MTSELKPFDLDKLKAAREVIKTADLTTQQYNAFEELFNAMSDALEYCITTRAVPDVPELVRYDPSLKYGDLGGMVEDKVGEYVRHDQAAAVIAAKDAEIDRLKAAIAIKGGTEHSPTQDAYDLACVAIEKHRERALAAEAKLAKIEKPETIVDCDHREAIRVLSLCKCTSCDGTGERNDAESGDMYFNTWVCRDCNGKGWDRQACRENFPSLYTAPVASDDEIEWLRAALEFYADTSKYPAPLTGGMGALWADCGEIARAALNPSEPRT